MLLYYIKLATVCTYIYLVCAPPFVRYVRVIIVVSKTRIKGDAAAVLRGGSDRSSPNVLQQPEERRQKFKIRIYIYRYRYTKRQKRSRGRARIYIYTRVTYFIIIIVGIPKTRVIIMPGVYI